MGYACKQWSVGVVYRGIRGENASATDTETCIEMHSPLSKREKASLNSVSRQNHPTACVQLRGKDAYVAAVDAAALTSNLLC